MLMKLSANYKEFILPLQTLTWTVLPLGVANKTCIVYNLHLLKKCPTYAPEQEWLEQQQLERDQQQMWSILNSKNLGNNQ